MNCPVCKNSVMIVLELDKVEVDYCLSCNGIWLDSGELEILLENSSEAQNLLKSLTDIAIDEDRRKCPICRKKMQKISAGSADQPVIIDKCPANHGLWFDKNELSNILAKANLDNDHKIQKLLTQIFQK